LRAVLHHLTEISGDREGWDWLELTLTPEQGWLEPEWLPDVARASGAFRLHKMARPCVVLPLPARWDDLRSGLKRNLKESLRRGVNSLAREGRAWSVSAPSGAEVDPALQTLVALHTARAVIDEKVPHPNYFTDPTDVAFVRDAVRHLSAVGHGGPQLLEIDGAPAAGRLVLHANGVTFFSFSGFNPQWWAYNTPTTLMAETLRAAIARGDRLANLSLGPDVAKLRWSNQLQTGHDFVVVAPQRRSRIVFTLFWQLRAAALVERERRYCHRPLAPTPVPATPAAEKPCKSARDNDTPRSLAG
jgi:CelD/BcsL family acetyltransferase involved in cellulose biosynthesis